MARHGYDAICAHSFRVLCHIGNLVADNRTLFYDGKMCECTQISYRKNVTIWVNVHIKNVNDVDFDTNINSDIRMKVNDNVSIYRHKAAYCRQIYLSTSCVLLSISFMCMMM